MTDTMTAPAASQAPVFQLQRLYLKDASLEMPNTPQIFLEAEAPMIDVQLEVSDAKVADVVHEVIVRVTVTAKVKDKVLFLVEAKQAGIFEIRNLLPEQMGPVLGVMCPGIVYPYLRSNIADMISRTGMPPVHLAEINFDAFYQQKRAAAEQAANTPLAANGSGAANA